MTASLPAFLNAACGELGNPVILEMLGCGEAAAAAAYPDQASDAAAPFLALFLARDSVGILAATSEIPIAFTKRRTIAKVFRLALLVADGLEDPTLPAHPWEVRSAVADVLRTTGMECRPWTPPKRKVRR